MKPIDAVFDFITPLVKAGIYRWSRSSYPKITGEINLKGLKGKVDVVRDKWGVPHITAQSLHDLHFAQGFVHAQDRLWQMELNRRLAQGQLSEIVGEKALDTDRAVRTFGFHRIAARDIEMAEPEVIDMFQSYVDGINAFIDQAESLPVEFKLLRIKPRPFTLLDVAAFARMVAWQMAYVWYGSAVRAMIINKVGERPASELEIHYPDVHPSVLEGEALEMNKMLPDGKLEAINGPFLKMMKGSNAWAVSGEKSATGKAVLCNDPHLAMLLPSVWYENHLKAPGYHCTGVSMPGMPMVLIGHNEKIGWGITLAYTSTQDLLIEQFVDDNLEQYEVDGVIKNARIIEEKITVKGRKKPHNERVVETHNGPIISDFVGIPDKKLSIRSMALRPSKIASGLLKINLAKNWDDFVEAVGYIEAPGLNLVYADVEGNIGYWVSGKVPIRAKGDGSVPVPAYNGQYDWLGEVPFEKMPHILNPKSGYVISCNHRIVTDKYPYKLGFAWMNGCRARRVEDFFRSKDKLTLEDHKKLHMDVLCYPGLQLKNLLIEIKFDDKELQEALKPLSEWDGNLTPESRGGLLYQVMKYFLIKNILEPELGEQLTHQARGTGFHPILGGTSEMIGHDAFALFRMLEDEKSWWIGRAGGKESVIKKSARDAVEWLKVKLGHDANQWQWGKLHQVELQHPMGEQKPLDKVFNIGPATIGGDTDTVCQTSFMPDKAFGGTIIGPSYRQIIDFSNFSNSLSVLPPGQSGHVGHQHYKDQFDMWLNGDYKPMLWTEEDVEQHAVGRLRFVEG